MTSVVCSIPGGSRSRVWWTVEPHTVWRLQLCWRKVTLSVKWFCVGPAVSYSNRDEAGEIRGEQVEHDHGRGARTQYEVSGG